MGCFGHVKPCVAAVVASLAAPLLAGLNKLAKKFHVSFPRTFVVVVVVVVVWWWWLVVAVVVVLALFR